MEIRPLDLINELIPQETPLNALLVTHSRAVAGRALAVARGLSGRTSGLSLDMRFIEEAALLHDIGVYLTDAPAIGCRGTSPYVCHGYLGRQLLEERGLFRHALVCERHVGVGLSAEEIRIRRLPLPERDMLPQSLEEEIICYADKFFSKQKQPDGRALSVEAVLENLKRYGDEKVRRFLQWAARFEKISAEAAAAAGGAL
jgi:uncharacterized protein